MSGFHLAQFNIARLAAPIEAPESAAFREALDRINALAEGSPGFVWRATGAGFESEVPAEDIDPMILANLSVWKSAEALAAFAYRSGHGHFVKHRDRWIEPAIEAYLVMGRIPAGAPPSRAEAFVQLEHLRADSASAHAFDSRTRYPAPSTLEPGR